MHPRKYFRVGTEVSAHDFSGQKIIGIYRGKANGLGAWIYGFPWGKDPIWSMHRCISTTIEARKTEQPLKDSTITFTTGEYCKGVSAKTNEQIFGKFMQVSGPKFAYIKEHSTGLAQKVLRSTLQKAS